MEVLISPFLFLIFSRRRVRVETPAITFQKKVSSNSVAPPAIVCLADFFNVFRKPGKVLLMGHCRVDPN